MTHTTITGAVTTTTNLLAGDSFVALEGSSLSDAFYGLTASGTADGTSVHVNGTISTQNVGAYLFGTDTGATDGVGGHLFIVGATGSLTGQVYAVAAAGSNNTFINRGEISAMDRDAFELTNGDFAHIENHGSIFGNRFGIRFVNGDGVSVVNSGTIQAMDFEGVILENAQGSIFNSGTISSVFGGSAIRLYSIPAQGRSEIVNTGTISGRSVAIDATGAQGGLDLVNSGLIKGDVDLSGANDTFDGRGGTVLGEVNGGDGNDIYIVDDADIDIVEGFGKGTDLVRASVNYELGIFVENLKLIGSGDTKGMGNTDNNAIDGNSGDNVLSGDAGEDTISGYSGDDILRGNRDNDTLNGSNGDDILRGGLGDDILNGGNGDDLLIGGKGRDVMTGGLGDDVFRFTKASESLNSSQQDIIADFDQGADLIDLSDLVQSRLFYIGSHGFSGKGRAEVQAKKAGANALIKVDIDGDKHVDMKIKVMGFFDFDATDFLL